MKEITIKQVDNGYVIEITGPVVQSMYESTNAYVAKDADEVMKILKEQL